MLKIIMTEEEILRLLKTCRTLYLKIYNVEDYRFTSVELACLIELRELLNIGLLNRTELFATVGITVEEIVYLIGVYSTIKKP